MLQIPIFIGISRRFDVVKGLTARSILSNTQADVDIVHLYPERESGCTGFSNVRFDIKYGIYLDCDMIVLGDIAELWSYRRPGRFVCMRDGSTEVAVIDCEHLCRNKNETYKLPMAPIIPGEWNVEDYRYGSGPLPENIKLLHFTALDTQPWFHDHPNQAALDIYQDYR